MFKTNGFEPTTLTIFGATGDLSANYLLPTLYHMDTEGLLPSDFRLVCVGRRPFDKNQFLDFIVKKSRGLSGLKSAVKKKHFLRHLDYYRGDFSDVKTFSGLGKLLEIKEYPKHQCYNRLYYFATPPEFFPSIARILHRADLLKSCQIHNRKVRVLVEKPFGFDLKTAKLLNKSLLRYFSEDQIYRIDHYLAKETVQNLMVARFANVLFEPLWNKDNIDHVEISALYENGVGGRIKFYEQTGALRDIVQNHILQMLALIAMNEPRELLTDYIRKEKVKVLKNLRLYDKRISSEVVRGQYKAYEKEAGKKTDTETFVAMTAYIDSPRWQGVPFYLRTGMKLSRKVTEISVHFKELKRCLFKGCASNVLIFRIQPDESVELQINSKVPGLGVNLHQANLQFGYDSTFKGYIPLAYERLLLDFFQGDQRLFISTGEIEAAWQFIDSVRKNWNKFKIFKYDLGSNGPKEADSYIKRQGREWWTR